MKTLIIIALVWFIIKKQKPHKSVIAGVAQGFALVARTSASFGVGAWGAINAFWSLVFMEVERAKFPKNAEQIKQEYNNWIELRKLDLNERNERAVALQEDSPTRPLKGRRYWECCYNQYAYSEVIQMFTGVTAGISLFVGLVVLTVMLSS